MPNNNSNNSNKNRNVRTPNTRREERSINEGAEIVRQPSLRKPPRPGQDGNRE